MAPIRLAYVCVLLMACSASDAVAPGMRGPLAELRSLDARGYQGGLTRAELELAETLASEALASGIPRKACEAHGPRYGELLSGSAPTPRDRISSGVANPVLDALKSFIAWGNRKQRDVAVVALGRIGPGAEVEPELLEGQGAWSPEALSAVTCMRRSPPDVHDLWSRSRGGRVSWLGYEARSALAVELMIEQMLDRTLVWPDQVFTHSLGNRGYDKGLTAERVGRLLPILTDAAYPASIRLQAIEFVRHLARGLPAFETPLAALYDGDDPELSAAAGAALVAIGSVHGADVLADAIESDDHDRFPGRWGPDRSCVYPPRSERLVRALLARLDDETERVRVTAIRALGCLREASAIGPLLVALQAPFWTQQREALRALARMRELPPDTVAAVERMGLDHWSVRVREAAQRVPEEPTGRPGEAWAGFFRNFHRTAIEHGLPVCQGREPGNGPYSLPWLGVFEVRWEDAKGHELPIGFPGEVVGMRGREARADRPALPGRQYGSDTFLRAHDGWLFSIDRWHYDGDLGFVSDTGVVDRFAPETTHAAFILETQLGTTLLGQDVFGGGEGGTLALLSRTSGGSWSYEAILELPSEAFAHAFAPDGTLLVKDPYGAVAITRDRRIVPLACP